MILLLFYFYKKNRYIGVFVVAYLSDVDADFQTDSKLQVGFYFIFYLFIFKLYDGAHEWHRALKF